MPNTVVVGKMTQYQYSSNLITLTLAPISADINPQPAGGWDSWVPPVNFQAPYVHGLEVVGVKLPRKALNTARYPEKLEQMTGR